MKRVWLGGLFAACCSTVLTAAQGPKPFTPAIDLEREVERISALFPKGELWPGYDPLSIPLAVAWGPQTYLFRHPSPPAGFKPVTGATPNTFVRDGRLEEVTANSSAKIGGVLTATILPGPPTTGGPFPQQLAPVAFHEAFHVFQRARHPDWIANELDLIIYNFEVPQLLSFRRLESDALRRALLSYDAEKSKCWIRTALAFRKDRFGRMSPAFSAYERATELNEGLATYIEARAADRIIEMPANEFKMSEVRQRAYASGSAIAALLDRFLPNWKRDFESGDRKFLDVALGEAAGTGTACAFQPLELEFSSRRAWADQDTLWSERSKLHTAFMAKPGWQLKVEASVLFPQGFDPLNMLLIGTGEIFHSRFLKAGNDNGAIEILNTESETEGAGVNPLGQGFRKVVVTGLAKPDVTDSLGTVTVKAPGVSLKFKSALVKQEGTTVTVQVLQR